MTTKTDILVRRLLRVIVRLVRGPEGIRELDQFNERWNRMSEDEQREDIKRALDSYRSRL